MLLGDYNKGRPLTAKRIAKVEVAILNHIFTTHIKVTVDGAEVGTGDLAKIFKGALKPAFMNKTENNEPGAAIHSGENPSINDYTDNIGGNDINTINTVGKKVDSEEDTVETKFKRLEGKAKKLGGVNKLPLSEKSQYYILHGQVLRQQRLDIVTNSKGKNKNLIEDLRPMGAE
jgi:hypothetical protein